MANQQGSGGSGRAMEIGSDQGFVNQRVLYGINTGSGIIGRPAIVTEVGDGMVSLAVFHPDRLEFTKRIAYSPELALNCWSPILTSG